MRTFLPAVLLIVVAAIDGPVSAARRKRGARARKPAIAVEPAPGRLALTVNETAWELNCSPNTVWSLVSDGTLPSFKLNRKRLIARSSIQEFIASGGTEVR